MRALLHLLALMPALLLRLPPLVVQVRKLTVARAAPAIRRAPRPELTPMGLYPPVLLRTVDLPQARLAMHLPLHPHLLVRAVFRPPLPLPTMLPLPPRVALLPDLILAPLAMVPRLLLLPRHLSSPVVQTS